MNPHNAEKVLVAAANYILNTKILHAAVDQKRNRPIGSACRVVI